MKAAVGMLTLVLLAGDVAAASAAPPMVVTTMAVMRVLLVMGESRFGELTEVLPCSVYTVQQQLQRLVGQGLVRRRVVREGRRGRKMYSLTEEGVRMVMRWEEMARGSMIVLRKVLQRRSMEGR